MANKDLDFPFPGASLLKKSRRKSQYEDQPDDTSFDASNPEKFFSCRYDVMIKIKHQLKAGISSLKTISVVGMGGIGKTTLAQGIYEDTEILCHFHVRAWVTISQEYKLRNVLLRLLKSICSLPSEVAALGDEEFLGEMLRKRLKGMRYLIVLDNVWNCLTWNELEAKFPNDNNGSRIILTTRVAGVAACADLDTPHCLKCLSIDESWMLLCNKLFVGKPCPPYLKEIGMEIAKGCQGIPLAIVVVAGYLSKIDMNHYCWADFAKGLASILSRSGEQVALDILSLSYNHLPQYLRSCFLCMAFFPKNSEILITQVIRLWCAAGFLSAEFPESMEDKAEKCMEELINRNLITVKKKYDGIAKTCGIHDLLWDLCRNEGHYCDVRQTHSTSFRYLIGSFTSSGPCWYSPDRWSSALNSDFFGLLAKLDIHSLYLNHFPDEVTRIVSLRYLELATCANIPASISKLCNLETLINNYKSASQILPEEIWLLKQLRHLHVGACTFLPNTPDSTVAGSSVSILPHLQTLSTISFASCTRQVFSSIPKLKQLKIHEMGAEDVHLFDSLNNLSCLRQLENLKMNFCMSIRIQGQNLLRDTFPPSIKKLTLRGSHLPWEDMDILSKLPNLEVLKLRKNAFRGPVYEQSLEFSRLKFLLFENLDLEQWTADSIHFPVLQHLVVKFCKSLELIPSCFGEIPTLESIWLYACSCSANRSAGTIQQEQWDCGNYHIRVHIEEGVSELRLWGNDRNVVHLMEECEMLLAGRFFGDKIAEKEQQKGIVGQDDVLLKIKEQLTVQSGQLNRLEIITIVGMGGIGKTTLAKAVFDDGFIKHHFYVRAWIKVSQVYQLRDLLLGVLRCICHLDDQVHMMNPDELKEELRRKLKGQRFLIVMDDLWSTEALDFMNGCFPDDNNGSRILLTTRQKNLALQVSSKPPPHEMRLLDKEQSWGLMHYQVFAKEICPSELVEIGKKIAEKCHGLPLSILVIGGALSSKSRTCNSWEDVAENLNLVLTNDPDKCLDIVVLRNWRGNG